MTVNTTHSIVDVAASNGRTDTLVEAVTSAGLVETLSTGGPFTVFAPVDEAFMSLPSGTLDAVLADEDLLTSVLTYHVVPGTWMAADVISASSLGSVEGHSLPIVVDSEGVHVGTAKIIATDIMTDNGVIHLIDGVLMPE